MCYILIKENIETGQRFILSSRIITTSIAFDLSQSNLVKQLTWKLLNDINEQIDEIELIHQPDLNASFRTIIYNSFDEFIDIPDSLMFLQSNEKFDMYAVDIQMNIIDDLNRDQHRIDIAKDKLSEDEKNLLFPNP